MVSNGSFHFVLTLKGSEELASRTYRLDVKLRNILFLIAKGSASFDAILQHSIFPREEVLERVRGLINDKFIALSGAPGAAPESMPAEAGAALASPATAAPAAPRAAPRPAAGAFPTLEPGISLSQARFQLSDFCLDQFGARGQEKVDTIQAAKTVGAMQRVLDDIHEELRGKPNALEALADRVQEINENKV
jgi:hypothetical protein